MKKFFLPMAALLVFMTAMTACKNGASDGKAKDELLVAVNSLSTALDPMLANYRSASSIGRHIFNTLVQYDANNRIAPQIAASWTRPDDLTWEIKLDLASYKFHNGDPLTMEDVLFSIERCRDIPQAGDYVERVAGVSARGDTLIVKTTIPDNGLLHKWAGLIITSKKAVQAAGDNWGQTAMGTGPYKLVSFIPSNEVVIERWDAHPSLEPNIRKMTFRAVSDATSRYIGIENGEFDIVDQVSSAGDIKRALANENLNAQIVRTLGLRFMAVNARKPPFDNPLVREALQYTIDRSSIISLLNGIDEPANTMISGALPAHSDVKVGEFNPARAKELLVQAGYPDGFATTLWIYNDSQKTLAEMMQAVMAQAGITVTIEQYQIGAFFERLDNGDHMMLLGSQTADPHEVSSLNMYYSDQFFGSAGNFGFYANPQAIALITKAMATHDPEEEIRLCKEVQELVAKDNPYFPISYTADCVATAKNLRGCEFYTNSQWYFGSAYFE